MLFTRHLGQPNIQHPVLAKQVLKSGGNHVNCCDETVKVMSEQQQVVS